MCSRPVQQVSARVLSAGIGRSFLASKKWRRACAVHICQVIKEKL